MESWSLMSIKHHCLSPIQDKLNSFFAHKYQQITGIFFNCMKITEKHVSPARPPLTVYSDGSFM